MWWMLSLYKSTGYRGSRSPCLAAVVLVAGSLAGSLAAIPAPAATPGSGGFLENIGQLADQVMFSTSTPGMAVFLTDDGVVIDAFDPLGRERVEAMSSNGMGASRDLSDPRSVGRKGHVVRIRFEGGRSAPVAESGATLPGVLNFLEGPDPASQHTGARRFAEVAYRDVWPGIDLVFWITPDGIAYETILSPDADPAQIRFEYDGPDHVLNLDGAVRLETSVGSLAHRLPVPGETNGGIWRGDVGASSGRGEGCDPFAWMTFLGGAEGDWGSAIAHDAQGRPIVTGVTQSSDFPLTPGAYSDSSAIETDVFVTKLNANGSDLVWSTYIGGSGGDAPSSVNLDGVENVVIGGFTWSANFPTTPGAYDEMGSFPLGDRDGFVLKLSADGSELLWSTYLGGGAHETLCDAVLDADDNVLVCGYTFSVDFPTTPGAYRTAHPGDPLSDGFIAKLSSGGDALVWSTLLGADNEDDEVLAIDLDPSGKPVVGGAAHDGFPTTPGAFQETHGAGVALNDGFLTKLAQDGTALIWSTFVGGSDGDLVLDLDIEPASGDVLAAMRTASGDFYITPGAFDASHNGGRDGAAIRMSADGTTAMWSTYLGGTGTDNVAGIALLPYGDVVIVGDTDSGDFPMTPNAFDPTYNEGMQDGFIALLTIDGSSLLWSTYVGGQGENQEIDDGFGGADVWSSPVVAFGDGADATILVTGWAGSAGFPTCPGAWDTTFEGVWDTVILSMQYRSVDVPGTTGGGSDRLRLASWPNPFRNGAAITFELPATGSVQVTVHDVAGRLVRVLGASERLSAGTHQLTWDGRDSDGSPVMPGVYFVRLETPDRQSTQRIVRLR